MVLLVAPISTAGAFSTEMARGHIFLMLVTGMTPAEIVCGTLCARLLPALSGVACVVPVLVLSSQLAGISIVTLIDLEIVTAGTALVGCTLALSLSIGARRLHETLMATYVILVGWVLGPPILLMIGTTSVGRFVPGWLTGWLLSVNPYWLILGPIVRPGFYRPHEPWSFVAGTTVLALALAVFTAWRLRPTALAVAGGARARPWLSRLVRYRPLVSLDSHPVFWRECRLQQPSRWTRVLWRMYVAGAILFTALAVWECATKGPAAHALGWSFQRVSGCRRPAVAERRYPRRAGRGPGAGQPRTASVHSDLNPNPGAQQVVRLLPCGTGAGNSACNRGGRACAPYQRWLGVPLVYGLVLAQGAAVTSLGIALATWIPRVDRC